MSKVKKPYYVFVSLFIINSLFVGKAFTQDIRDVKSPVGFPENHLILVSILVLFVILVVGSWFIYKKIKGEIKVSDHPKTHWEIAIERLNLLERDDLLTKGAFEQYYDKLSTIVRQYFEHQFNIRAPEMTTEEFLRTLKNFRDLNEHNKGILKEFLNSCDMVKFAKHSPGVQEAEKSFKLAEQLICETKGNAAQ